MPEGPPPRYEDYAFNYFVERSRQFEVEQGDKEYFLAWLLRGVIAEVEQRAREDRAGTLQALAVPGWERFEDSVFALPAELDEAPLRVRYQAWEDLRRSEFNVKFHQARLTKDRLIAGATPAQKARMFRWDLESALLDYRDGDWRGAIMKFTELSERYGYRNLADVYFLRGECYNAVGMIDLAAQDYQRALDLGDPEYNLRALERLLVMSGERSRREALVGYWTPYEQAADRASPQFQTMRETVARYFYALRDWNRARALFEQVPPESPRYPFALLRIGDCFLAEGQVDSAALRYATVLAMGTDKKFRKTGRPVLREAALKMGYAEYIRGKWESALSQVEGVEGTDAVAERAAVLKAWCWFKLHAYDRAQAQAHQVLKSFPKTNYEYELTCLVGFCDEVLGNDQSAMEGYTRVITAMDDRQAYHDFNYERQAALAALSNLRQIEPALFLGGYEELFGSYLDLQQKLTALMESVQLTEGARANPKVKEIVDERAAIYRLVRENQPLQDSIASVRDVRLSDAYEQVVFKLSDLIRELDAGIRYWLAQTPLIQREQQASFQALVADSLDARIYQEWQASDRALAELERLRAEAGGTVDLEVMTALAGVQADLVRLRDRMVAMRGTLGDLSREPVESNIDWWSWYAVSRRSTESSKFEAYYASQSRLAEIDRHIQSLSRIVNERLEASRQVAAVDERLKPKVEAGVGGYVAPPAPMWKPPTPPAVEPTPAEPAEEPSETAAPETPPTEARPVPTEGTGPAPKSAPPESPAPETPSPEPSPTSPEPGDAGG